MPSADADVARRLYGAIENRDMEALEDILDPDVEWITPPSLPWGGTRRGIAGVKEFAGELADQVNDREVEVDEIIDVGDGELVVLGRFRGEARLTGSPMEAEFAHHVRVTGGKIGRFQNYIDSGEILRALGEPPSD